MLSAVNIAEKHVLFLDRQLGILQKLGVIQGYEIAQTSKANFTTDFEISLDMADMGARQRVHDLLQKCAADPAKLALIAPPKPRRKLRQESPAAMQLKQWF